MLDKLAGLWYNENFARQDRERATELYHKNAILSIGKIHKKMSQILAHLLLSQSPKFDYFAVYHLMPV